MDGVGPAPAPHSLNALPGLWCPPNESDPLKLGIVIINYNTSADLDRCLESLAAYPPASEHKVVIVDNASSDAGLKEVHARYPDNIWLFNNDNLGYAKGGNQGMAAVEADYYLILNPDIVIQPGGLDHLLSFADQNPRVGMVAPQLLNEDGSVQESCRRFYTLKTLLLRRTFFGRIFPNSETVRLHLMQDFDHLSARPVDWALGGCLLVRNSAMERTGPMDERFFLYFEDVDWCYRMWQAGFEVQYTPDARFIHRHRRDSAKGKFNKTFWLHLGSLLSFYEKWGMLIWLLKKWRDPLLTFLWWVMDLTGLTVAFWTAYGLRGLMGGLFAEPLYAPSEYAPLLYFSWLLASATFLLTGRYRPGALRDDRSASAHLRQVGIVSVLLLASTYLGHQDFISRAVLLMFIPLLAAITAGGDGLFRRLLRRLERGHFSLERTLLVGPPGRIQKWLAQARDLTSQGVDVAGYVVDPSEGGGLPPLAGGDVPWLGRRSEIIEVVRRYRISQVVFWDNPEVGEAQADGHWQLLASLRRMRVRLRWQAGSAWLLATGARPEVFGRELSAVQGSGSGMAVRALGDRLGAVALGIALGVLGLGPWLWLRLVRAPAGKVRWQSLTASDLWGHDPRLTLAVSESGQPLPLWNQWRLAGPLLRGHLAVLGPRPWTMGRVDIPREPEDLLDFWQSEPRAPGLAGTWSRERGQKGWGAWWATWKQLWQNPGGLGVLGAHLDDNGEPSPEESAAQPQSYPSQKTDPDVVGDTFPSG